MTTASKKKKIYIIIYIGDDDAAAVGVFTVSESRGRAVESQGRGAKERLPIQYPAHPA